MIDNGRLDFYKGEDRLALKERWKELRKKYSDAYSNDEIALLVFDGLRDAHRRAPLALQKWLKEKDVIELLSNRNQEEKKDVLFEDLALQRKYDELEELKDDCEKDYLKYRIIVEQNRMIEEENKRKERLKESGANDNICGLPIFEIKQREY